MQGLRKGPDQAVRKEGPGEANLLPTPVRVGDWAERRFVNHQRMEFRKLLDAFTGEKVISRIRTLVNARNIDLGTGDGPFRRQLSPVASWRTRDICRRDFGQAGEYVDEVAESGSTNLVARRRRHGSQVHQAAHATHFLEKRRCLGRCLVGNVVRIIPLNVASFGKEGLKRGARTRGVDRGKWVCRGGGVRRRRNHERQNE